MRAIVQRVKSASVEVEGQRIFSLGHGFLVLAEILAQKLVNLAGAVPSLAIEREGRTPQRTSESRA